MKTVTLYTPAELKELDSDAFDKALEWFQDEYNDEVPWTGEIMDSLKAVIKASGLRLLDWSIGAYSYSDISVEMDSDVEELSGNRALAWLENNLLSNLREHRTFVNRVKKYEHWHDFTRYGAIPSCPLTGVCFDEDFIDALLKSVKDGDTLKDAYNSLADVARKLFESEIEAANSEENFLEQDHLTFTEDGEYVYS